MKKNREQNMVEAATSRAVGQWMLDHQINTNRELATLLRMSEDQVGKIRRTGSVRSETLARLLDAFGLTAVEFYALGEGPKPTNKKD